MPHEDLTRAAPPRFGPLPSMAAPPTGDPRHERRRLRVGRDPSRVDFAVGEGHTDVGRHQADVVLMADGRVYLVPQPSTNPTRLNERVLPAGEAVPLGLDDAVAFGTYRLDLRVMWALLDPGPVRAEGSEAFDDDGPAGSTGRWGWAVLGWVAALVAGLAALGWWRGWAPW